MVPEVGCWSKPLTEPRFGGVEASCVVLEEDQRWLLDALPAELSEQVFMQLREEVLEHSQEGQ